MLNRSLIELTQAVSFIRDTWGITDRSDQPTVGIVLGSGLGEFANRMEPCAGREPIPYADIPHFPPPSGLAGHAGKLCFGRVSDVDCVVMQGRVHAYEGHSLSRVVFPIRIMARLGVKTIIFTNAAGGINSAFKPGDLVAIEDHLNLMGGNPLVGPNFDELGPRFPDMSEVYDRVLREGLLDCMDEIELQKPHGVYAGLLGPSYETPAEIRMLRTMGADMVGMSTVPEAIAARHMGVRCVGISCITNLAAGISKTALSHEEVTATGAAVSERFIELLRTFIEVVL